MQNNKTERVSPHYAVTSVARDTTISVRPPVDKPQATSITRPPVRSICIGVMSFVYDAYILLARQNRFCYYVNERCVEIDCVGVA